MADLKYFAVVRHREAELLLVERIESSSRSHRLLLLNTRLAVHQVDLDVRRYGTKTHASDRQVLDESPRRAKSRIFRH